MAETDVRLIRGEALRAARTQAHLSARALAQRVNSRNNGTALTDHAIYSYERGKVLLAPEVAKRLASILRIAASELLIGDPDYADEQTPVTGLRRHTEGMTSAEAFQSGVICATAQELLDHAKSVMQAVGTLAQALDLEFGPKVDTQEFKALFSSLLIRLQFVTQSTFAKRAQRDPSRFEDLADLSRTFDQIHDQLHKWWRTLIRLAGGEGSADHVDCIEHCREVAEALQRISANLEDHIANCQKLLGHSEL